jgi:hypothetical protein
MLEFLDLDKPEASRTSYSPTTGSMWLHFEYNQL